MLCMTNEISPFKGNNFGCCMRISHLWQCVMTQDANFLHRFECRACVHAIQLSSQSKCVMNYNISHGLLHYTTRAITSIIDHGKVWLPNASCIHVVCTMATSFPYLHVHVHLDTYYHPQTMLFQFLQLDNEDDKESVHAN